MSELRLYLLGAPQVMRDGDPVDGFRSLKARALLFYVAVSRQAQSRTSLAGLLWGELPEGNANANLRKTLTNLRKVAGPHLTITRDAVALDDGNPLWLDVNRFKAALDGGDPAQLQTAVELYRGDFLDGFYLHEAPEFETWQLAQRHQLRERLLAALQDLAEVEAGRAQIGAAIGHARRLLALEPLREDVHRLLMSLLAQNGQRTRALAQYEVCAQVLARELDVQPDAKTTALFNRIRDGRFTPTPLAVPTRFTPPHNLPAPTTSFVGREAQLARVEQWLEEGAGRLLTITGPGGVGKTRLAQEAAWQAASRPIGDFLNGVWAVSLVSLQDVADLPILLAAMLGITFAGKGDPQTQVIRYLRRRKLLLLLDNAEHLVSQALADFLMDILTRAPEVKLIVTSRQRLQMQAEWVLDLPGLAYPQAEAVTAAATYPAGKLFLERAEGHGRPLAAALTQEAIHRLCRLVDGLPLALELAASWIRTLSPQQIVVEIERSLDVLATELRDVAPRHRSMQAVFDASWAMLQPEERRIMRQLAYFRGGISTQAAEEIAGASPAQLRSLANKSLLQRRGDDAEHNDRYELHELIRQYAAQKLAQRPDEAQALAQRHGQAFATFLAAREEAILGADYLQAKAQIDTEVDNVRKAWEWAVDTHSQDDIARSSETLHYYFFNTQGLFAEAAQRFERAAAEFAADTDPQVQALVGNLLLKAAVNRRMLGQLAEARRLTEESLSFFYRQKVALGVARATSTLGVIRLQQNDKKEALNLTQRAVDQVRDELSLGKKHGFDENQALVYLCICLNNLAYVLAEKGDYAAAVALSEESVALARDIGYPHGELSALNMLGVHYQWAGEGEKALRIFEELVARCRQAATQSRLAQAVNNLGWLYQERGQPERARPLLQEAVRLYESVGQVHYAAFVGVLLGHLALEQGIVEEARRRCLEALQVAQDTEMPALALDAITLFAEILRAEGQSEAAVSMLALAANHEATSVQTREQAQQTLQLLRETLSAPAFDAAQREGAMWTLEEGVRRVYI